MADRNRQFFIDAAKEIVCNDREKQYGTPEKSFYEIGKLWTAYKGIDFAPEDVAIMMMLLKVARIKNGRHKDDSWIDAIGYLACGAEISANGRPEI